MAEKDDRIYSPGMRLIVRDEEWILLRAERSTSGYALVVRGTSSLTQGRERVFLTELEKSIKVVDPSDVRFVSDRSPGFRNSLLFLETQLRQIPPTDDKIYVGHKGAIDAIDYQFTPAARALRAPRARILIADSVGLGKTIECGILLSELIKRGRGKRILVVTVKSMTTQFQKELWARFSIALTRLDSVGIARIRNKIPSNANPFDYYDKTIVSVDTLKRQDYRHYLEHSRWDIIAIDEAHNVAARNNSDRSKLAKALATRCDSLVMLTATPHDGKRSSFASLIDMLDPTAIVDPNAYKPEDVDELFVRRFKTDISADAQSKFQTRKVLNPEIEASAAEEAVFDYLANISFKHIDSRRKKGDHLFRTTLTKALFSSPAACRETIKNRIRRLEDETNSAMWEDREKLETLDALLAKVGDADFTRYHLLLRMLSGKRNGARSFFSTSAEPIDWNAKDPNDRLVVFTERVATLKYIAKRLREDLKLSADEVVELDASLGDVEVNKRVAEFGSESSKARILISTDVASEGVNLHHCSHRLIHFDTPWSLIVFQQRNGRVDRYGQTHEPEIYYLTTTTSNTRIQGDLHILELLRKKDQEVVDSIGDPTEFTKCRTAEDEEAVVGAAMDADAGEDAALTLDDIFGDMLEGVEPEEEEEAEEAPEATPDAALESVRTKRSAATDPYETGQAPTLFARELDYVDAALRFMQTAKDNGKIREALKFETDRDPASPDGSTVKVEPNNALTRRLKYYPEEVLPPSGKFILSDSQGRVMREYAKALADESLWPEMQLLWDAHPVVQFLNETVLGAFGRRCAPCLDVPDLLGRAETLYIATGVVPNRQSQPVATTLLGILCRDGAVVETQPLEYWIAKLGLRYDVNAKSRLVNRNSTADPAKQSFDELEKEEQTTLTAALKGDNGVIKAAERVTIELAERKQAELTAYRESYRRKLQEWREAKLRYAGGELFDKSAHLPAAALSRAQKRHEELKREVDNIYKDRDEWFGLAGTIESKYPSITVLAALRGER